MTKMINIQKKEFERLKSLNKNVDWELVDDFKQGLKELKENKVIKC